MLNGSVPNDLVPSRGQGGWDGACWIIGQRRGKLPEVQILRAKARRNERLKGRDGGAKDDRVEQVSGR